MLHCFLCSLSEGGFIVQQHAISSKFWKGGKKKLLQFDATVVEKDKEVAELSKRYLSFQLFIHLYEINKDIVRRFDIVFHLIL